VDMTRRNLEDKVRREVESVKMEKREQRDFMQIVRNQEHVKNTSLKQIIKSQQVEAREKKQRELVEKQMRAKQQVEDKMMREEQKRIEHQTMIERMEREELELIQRLQNTQLLQKAAYDDLENALGGNYEGANQSVISTASRPGTASNYRQQTGNKTGSKMGTRK
jgi:hypothetical protein